MRSSRQLIQATVLMSAFLFVTFAGKAHAYVDAGTGSYLLQLGMAAIFGAMLTARSYWGSIRSFLARVASRAPGTRR